jgi:signal transduction histidine kinase
VKKGLLNVLLMLLGTMGVSATPVIPLSDDVSFLRIATQCGWFVDSSARLTMSDVTRPDFAARFQPVRHDIGAFGKTHAAVWAYGSYTYAGTDKVYLLIDFANIDSITLFYYDKGALKTVQSGSHTLLKNKPHNIPGFTLELPATGGQPKEFWLRIRTGNAVIVPLAIATEGGLPESYPGMFLVGILYAGVVLAMFLYNLTLAIWIRDRAAYLYYLGYLFFLAVFILLYLLGFHVYLGQTMSSWINQYGIGAVAVSYMFALQFSISFLHGKEYAPRLTRVFNVLTWLLLITVACCLAGWRRTTIYQQEAICLAAPILFIGMAIKAWQINYKPAIVFIIAWGALIVSIVLFALTNMGVLPYGRWTFHLLPIGSAIEVVMLSKALWYRYALKEKAKRAKQEIQIQSAAEQNTLLEQKVSERTQELQKALEQLEEHNQAKDKMLNIIAHDIRSPLNNLSGFLELAEKKVVEAGQIQQFVHVLRRNISQIGKTMNNLLNWSLVHKNLIETVPSEVMLSPVTRQIMDTYRFSAEDKGVCLKKNMPEELVVIADSHQLELVLRNLLDNAIKFTPRAGTITIGCRPKNGHVVIYVSDTGHGMLQEEAEKLLHRSSFHTTGSSSNGKGTGLGLQLCKEFVASNGGVLQVKSVPGEGTEFYFSLPGKLQL